MIGPTLNQGRFRVVALTALVGVLLMSQNAWAQTAGSQPPAGRPPAPTGKKGDAILTLQQQLELTRRQRLELEARLEQQLAAESAERARRLQMGGEVGALQRLEQLLDSAQTRLLVQRDRIRQLGDAARQAEGAILVILLRADSLPAGVAAGDLATAVALDGTSRPQRTLSSTQTRTLAAGAAEELYRAEATPLAHTVGVTVAGKGLLLTESLQITLPARQVTYVEFAIRGGKLVPATWTSAAITP